MNTFEKYYEKCPLLIPTLIILSLTLIFIVFMEWGYFNYFIHFGYADWDIGDNIDKINSACLIILTFILVCVAWIQLHGIKRLSKADFLMRIDQRYCSLEIIKARAIIHRLHELAKDYHCNDERIQKIDEEIKKIGQNPMDALEFMYLLNFLDFLETIAYFCNQDYITLKDVDDLVGNSIIFYYKVFKGLIYYRKKKYNSNFYSELCTLVEKIDKHN